MDGRKLYVTNTKDGTISVIYLDGGATQTIATGGKPELVHPSHDRSLLYISNFFGNKIHVLDTRTDVIVAEIEGLDGPEDSVPSEATGALYVVNFNSSRVLSCDLRTLEKLEPELAVGAKPIGLAVAAGRGKLYVSNYGDNSVSVVAIPRQ